MIKVLLVDDHKLVRTGIKSLLESMANISVVAICACGEDALERLQQSSPDVVLMDINMPGIGGIETCRRIIRDHPKVKVIALSVHNDGMIPQQLLRLGASGFISKNCSEEEMIDAIYAALDGNQYLCTDVAENMAKSLDKKEPSPFNKLSQRELEVSNLILQGKSIQEMSTILMLSDKTVNTYRYRLYEKLSVKNDVELIYLAMKFKHLNRSS